MSKSLVAECKDKLVACSLLRLGKGIELEKRDKSESYTQVSDALLRNEVFTHACRTSSLLCHNTGSAGCVTLQQTKDEII